MRKGYDGRNGSGLFRSIPTCECSTQLCEERYAIIAIIRHPLSVASTSSWSVLVCQVRDDGIKYLLLSCFSSSSLARQLGPIATAAVSATAAMTEQPLSLLYTPLRLFRPEVTRNAFRITSRTTLTVARVQG
jgi:hypothetical protein